MLKCTKFKYRWSCFWQHSNQYFFKTKKNYQSEVEQLYRKHQFHYIWFDKDGLNEFAGLLYNKVNNMSQEGLETEIPLQGKIRWYLW
jgi:hypothetical protein